MRMLHFTPLPPAKNGIADYAGRLNAELHGKLDLACVADNPFAEVPAGVEILDPLQVWRSAPEGALPVYQIGNNPDHVAIYRMALQHPGLVVLHDLRLFYLHELAKLSPAQFESMMRASNPIMAKLRAREIVEAGRKISSDYICFDMLGDLLRRSRKVMVHSHYARNILLRHYGQHMAERIAVLPHFSIAPSHLQPGRMRAQLNLPESAFLVVTSGFATRAKRFDWVIGALAQLVAAGREIFWVHAGAERPDEFDLSGLIAATPLLAGRTHVTGYVPEDELDAWMADADVVLNLRFPSVGESSGTLARAMAMGRCCVVTQTAAYDEYPEDTMVKCAPFDTVACLARALDALYALPEARAQFGFNAQEYARKHLSIGSFASRFAALCHEAAACSPLAGAPLLDRPEGSDRMDLGRFRTAELTSAVLAAKVPASFVMQSYAMRQDGPGAVTVAALGIDTTATGAP